MHDLTHDLIAGTMTAPVSEGTMNAIRRAQQREHPVALLIYHREGVETLPLQPGVTIVVGRAPPSHVQIRDSRLSREHARFTLSEGEKVTIEDLGSTNGTWVRGQRVRLVEVNPGDEVILGGVVAVIHALTPAESALPGFTSHERLRGALEEEVARARYFQGHFAVLMVRGALHDGAHISRWFARVRALLRPVDRVALYSSDTGAILMPEASPEAALELARKIAELRSEGAPPLLVGVAPFPAAATRAEELLELSLSAAQQATLEQPVRSAALGTWTPGDRPRRSGCSGGPVIVSRAMREIFDAVARLSRTSIPVLLQGETGTGKEVVARALHEQGKRRARPMVCVNCGAIPLQLLESTLFGHERGAFTGANQQQKGVFEAAHEGTVFLDEIGELPAAAQVALLRVLEAKRVVRVGSTREIEVDVRIIAATHRDLEAMSETGAFRLDLLYRLNAMTLLIPPLRERPEDIVPLALCFLEQANQDQGRSVRGVEPEALAQLQGYPWPGNVRELRNAIERALVIAEGDMIAAQDLPERVRAAAKIGDRVPAPSAGDEREYGGGSPRPPGAADDLKTSLIRYEADLIVSALRDAGWNQTEAARRLGVPLRTLVHKLKALGIRKLGYQPPDAQPRGDAASGPDAAPGGGRR